VQSSSFLFFLFFLYIGRRGGGREQPSRVSQVREDLTRGQHKGVNCSGSGVGDAAGVDAKSHGQKMAHKEIATTWLAGRRFWYTTIKVNKIVRYIYKGLTGWVSFLQPAKQPATTVKREGRFHGCTYA
jgi:hypothetical protein